MARLAVQPGKSMTVSLLAAAVLASGFLIGLIPTIVDGIGKPLQERLSLTDAQREWFVRFFYLTWLPGMPLAGILLDSWNVSREILFFGLVGVILGFSWLALARKVSLLYAIAFCLGFAYSFLTTTAI